MMFDDNIVFAIRTIFLYGKLKKVIPDYEYTFLCGTLLNVFSAIRPSIDKIGKGQADHNYVIHFNNVLNMEVPHLANKTDAEIKEHLRTLRNGIAHKTKNSFEPLPDNDKIMAIRIDNRLYTLEDLEKILAIIEMAIQDCQKDLYEKEKTAFNKPEAVK